MSLLRTHHSWPAPGRQARARGLAAGVIVGLVATALMPAVAAASVATGDSPVEAFDLTSSGPGPASQRVVVDIPFGADLALIDSEGRPTSEVTVPGSGRYQLDLTTFAIVFTPLVGYTGTPEPVLYRVTVGSDASASAFYTPTVTAPQPPAPADLTSIGLGTQPQVVDIDLPVGGNATLLDEGEQPVQLVTDAGIGTYSYDVAAGRITFVAVSGYVGTPSGVAFRVHDAYGQSGIGHYTPTVSPILTSPGPPALLSLVAPPTIRLDAPSPSSFTIRCVVDNAKSDVCRVTVTTTVAGESRTIATGREESDGTVRTAVTVRLNKLGKSLLAGHSSLRAVVKGEARVVDTTTWVNDRLSLRIVGPPTPG